MASNAFLISAPYQFLSSKLSHSSPYVSVQLKPAKFQISCYGSSSAPYISVSCLNRKVPLLKVSVIASQKEENNPVLFEEEQDGQVFEGNFDWDASENAAGPGEGDGVSGAVGDPGDDEGFVEPSEEAKVFVGNLPYDIDSEKLAQLFDQAGVVEIAEVIYNRDTDQSRGFGFVTMSTVEEADKAVDMFHRYDISGRLLTVNKAAPRGSQPERRPPRTREPSYRIYVGNLPWGVDDGRLEGLFSEHGKVISARVVSDRETGRSRGFGFVIMSSESEMNDAIGNLDGQNLDGRAIRVNMAEERQRRSGF